MMFTFYNLEELYSNHCHFMGWSESHMTKPEDAEVMFVLDTNRTVISQFEAVFDSNEQFVGFKINEHFDCALNYSLEKLREEWMVDGCQLNEF